MDNEPTNGTPVNAVEVHPLDGNRTLSGKFLPGNRAGVGVAGNGRKRKSYRAAMNRAIKESHIEKLFGILWNAATRTKVVKDASGRRKTVWDGEPWAVQEILNRALGRPKNEDDDDMDGDGSDAPRDIRIIIADQINQTVIVEGGGNGNGKAIAVDHQAGG